MLKGHLPRIIYHQVYKNTKTNPFDFPRRECRGVGSQLQREWCRGALCLGYIYPVLSLQRDVLYGEVNLLNPSPYPAS